MSATIMLQLIILYSRVLLDVCKQILVQSVQEVAVDFSNYIFFVQYFFGP